MNELRRHTEMLCFWIVRQQATNSNSAAEGELWCPVHQHGWPVAPVSDEPVTGGAK